MTSPLFSVLARTLTASTLAEPAVLETAAHGTVVTRAGFTRREVVRDAIPGEIPLLTAEVLASIAEGDAPGTDVGDLVYVSGALWRVRSPLADGGGLLKLQLTAVQMTSVDVGGDTVDVPLVGDPDGTASVVALAAPGVLRRSDLVTVEGDRYRVGTPKDWPAGDLRRYDLTPMYIASK